MADRKAFFDAVRASPFGGSLSDAQVKGCEAILDACARYTVTDPHHVANVLAQTYRETGGYMLPIKETVMPHHKDKNPSDATVISRLDRAFATGKLPWVKTPYWRSGWFGRGPIQITHEANYRKLGQRLGVDLVKNRDLALDRNVGASIAVVGMAEGLFTGKKLADYVFPTALDAPAARNPRRIVNGPDGSDAEVARNHRAFHKAVLAMGGVAALAPKPAPTPISPPDTKSPLASGVALAIIIILAVLGAAFFILGR